MKILVATIGFGSGHNRAAEAVAEDFRSRQPEADVRVVDFLNWERGPWDNVTSWFYFLAIEYWPSAYNVLYKLVAEATPLHRFIFGSYIRKMRKYLGDFPAEIVISTHVFCAKAASAAKDEGGSVKKTWGVLTDFMDDRYWNTLRLDRFFVASDDLKAKLAIHGITDDSIELAPIPVRAQFHRRSERGLACSKVHSRLDSAKFTVLALGGGNGLGSLRQVAAALADLPVQLIVVAGSNESLKNSLAEIGRYNHRLFVFGYVDNVHDMMDASDVCVTKPGGVTIAECMAKGVNIIIYGKPLPGPETENVEYLIHAKAAAFCSTPDELRREINRLIALPDREKRMNSL